MDSTKWKLQNSCKKATMPTKVCKLMFYRTGGFDLARASYLANKYFNKCHPAQLID